MKKVLGTLILLTLLAFEIADIRSIYNLPMQASAVCTADLDLDGDLDIVVNHGIDPNTNWGGIYMLGNDGYGHFSYMDSIYDRVGWVNYADTVFSKSYPDMLYNYHDSITVLSTNGENYTRSRFYVGQQVNDFDLGDVDGNGHTDLVFISSNNHYWGIIYNQGNYNFSEPVYYQMENVPSDIACSDLDGDGRSDIVLGSYPCYVMYSKDTGFEMLPLQHEASHVSIADMDNDGDKDIITVADIVLVSRVYVYENLNGGVFDSVANFKIPEGCSKFFVTDFNNDSLPDLLFMTYNSSRNLLLYYNKGGFQFGDSLGFDLDYYGETRRFMQCADMDGNGYNDIIISRQVYDLSYNSSPLEILFNDSHGHFVENPLTTIETLNSKSQTQDLTCYPNPFKSQANIEYAIDKECLTLLDIYDLNGRKIKELKNTILSKGKYKITWNGTDQYGKEVSSGVYIISLAAGGQKQQCRLMYMK